MKSITTLLLLLLATFVLFVDLSFASEKEKVPPTTGVSTEHSELWIAIIANTVERVYISLKPAFEYLANTRYTLRLVLASIISGIIYFVLLVSNILVFTDLTVSYLKVIGIQIFGFAVIMAISNLSSYSEPKIEPYEAAVYFVFMALLTTAELVLPWLISLQIGEALKNRTKSH